MELRSFRQSSELIQKGKFRCFESEAKQTAILAVLFGIKRQWSKIIDLWVNGDQKPV